MKSRTRVSLWMMTTIAYTALVPITGCGGETEPADGSSSSGSSGTSSSGSSGSNTSSSGGGSSGGSSSGGSSSSSGSSGVPLTPTFSTTPKLARAGAIVTLRGSNFRSAQGDSTFALGGQDSVAVQSWSDDAITFRMPKAAHGVITVSVTIGAVPLTTTIRVLGRSSPNTFDFGKGHIGLAAIDSSGSLRTWGCPASATGSGAAICQSLTYTGVFKSIGYGGNRLYATGADDQLEVWTNRPSIPAYVPAGTYRSVHAASTSRIGVTPAGAALLWTNDTDDPVVTTPLFEGSVIGDLSLGAYFATALLDDGTVRAQTIGRPAGNEYECGETEVPSGLTGIVAVASGNTHALALRDDGTVVGWGGKRCHSNPTALANVPAGLDRVVALSAGFHHSLALRDDGTVVGWGADDGGSISGPTATSNVVAIRASTTSSNSAVLLEDGTLRVWAPPTGMYTEMENIPAGLHVKLPD